MLPGTFLRSSLHYQVNMSLYCLLRGHAIMEAILDDLLESKGMSNASDVILTGCSGQQYNQLR